MLDERSRRTTRSAYQLPGCRSAAKTFSPGACALISSQDSQRWVSTVSRCRSQARSGHPSKRGSSGHGTDWFSDTDWYIEATATKERGAVRESIRLVGYPEREPIHVAALNPGSRVSDGPIAAMVAPLLLRTGSDAIDAWNAWSTGNRSHPPIPARAPAVT